MSSSTIRRKANESANKQLRRSWRAGKGKWPLHDPEYLKWIRQQPCLCCEAANLMLERQGERKSFATEAAHVGLRGLAQKSSDRETIPLCRWHHREGPFSAHKLQKVFWKFWNFNRDRIVTELNREYDE